MQDRARYCAEPAAGGENVVAIRAYGGDDMLEIIKEPFLQQLRTEVAVLKRVVDAEPDQVAVARAWTALGKIQEALRELCPNHPQLWQYRR